VLNAAARVVTGTRKFDHGLGHVLNDQLHRLDVPDWVLFKLAVTVHQCLNGHTLCRSTASQSPVLTCVGICVLPTIIYLPYRISSSTLTAVGHSQLLVQWPQTLPGFVRDATNSTDCFRIYLKRTCSRDTSASSALGVLLLNDNALFKIHAVTHSLRSGMRGQ